MRVHLGRPLSGLWLDHEVPVLSVETTETLNGPGSITVTVPSDYHRRKATDGHTFIHEWGSILVVEDDQDRIIATGLVDQVTPGDTVTTVEAGGISMVLTGCPYKGKSRSLINAPVANVARVLVEDYQGYEASALGITVVGSVPGVTVGVDASAKWKEANARYVQARKALEYAKKRQADQDARVKSLWVSIFHQCGMSKIGKIRKRKSAPTTELKTTVWMDTSTTSRTLKSYNSKSKAWVSRPTATTTYGQWEAAKRVLAKLKSLTRVEKTAADKTKEWLDARSEEAAQPFLLNWWDTQDMSSVLGDLVTAGAEWVEESAWDGQDIKHSIRFRKPGQVRRDDLRFEVGVNIQDRPEVGWADPYTGVFVLGAGEGSKTVHASSGWDAGGRVRRVKVVSDQDQKSTAAVQKLAASELAKIKKQTGVTITSITVTDHPFARWQSYGVGDIIRVIGPVQGVGDVDVWCRITERTMTGSTDKVTLTLEATE
ncbi:hypothetical protein [Galactobacter sp.]|uniref:hypothetical protein n=1 Tax=Galactobacter sp. TaxID=2676125 RepID=UPI0025BD0D3A|nr:hypothetical protein [Galactobacter sp.]